MQAFTAQRLAAQADNPFANVYVLASLLVPHLETYLAAHAEVRFLVLEYAPQHLAAVLALQRLVGVDLLKVAQLVDAGAGEPLSFTHVQGASVSGLSPLLSPLPGSRSNPGSVSGALSPASMAPATPRSPAFSATEAPSLTRANFLLTSSATETEVSAFVAAVRRVLVAVSPAYAEEEPERKSSNGSSKSTKRKPSPLAGPFSPFPKMGLQSPPRTPLSMAPSPRVPDMQMQTQPPMPAHTQMPTETETQTQTETQLPALQLPIQLPAERPDTPVSVVNRPLSARPPSIAETIKSIPSMLGRPATRARRLDAAPRPQTTMSVVYLDDEDDSDDDGEVRRLMPLYLRRLPTRKGNSRKALKFLGLA